MMPAEVHIEPTHNDRHGAIRAHTGKEQCRVLHVYVIMHIQQDRKPGNRQAERPNGEQEPMLGQVAEHGDEHAEGKRGDPRRHGAQLGLDGREVVALDDGRGEVGVPVSRDDEAQVHEAAEPNTVIGHDGKNVAEADASLGGIAAGVGLQAGLDVGTLVLVEPLGLLREGWEGEEEDGAGYDGD